MRVVWPIPLLIVWIVGTAPAVAGGMDADFIGNGTFASVENCEKLIAIRASRSSLPTASTSPETLQKGGLRGGHYGLEGACLFTRVKEMEPSQRWSVDFYCFVSNNELQKTGEFQRMIDGSLNFVDKGNQQVTNFVPCDWNGYISD